jgi:hypothetical protein
MNDVFEVIEEKDAIPRFVNEIFDVNNVPKILYHATYMPHLKSIKRHGLGGAVRCRNYEISDRGVVYLARSAEIAASYAETSDIVPKEWLDEIIVFAINIRSLAPRNIYPDRNNLLEFEAGRATYEYRGVIPFAKLKTVEDGDRY